MNPLVYRDSVIVIAAGKSYVDMRYGINRSGGTAEAELVLNQEEARELAAALTWIISEVDARHGYDSFKPSERSPRHYQRQRKSGVPC